MPRLATPLVLIAACLAVSACASQAERVSNKEDLLAAAGFTVRPANTPERQASLLRLPPNRFVQQAKGNSVAYVYADPLVCDCLYIGDQQAYGRYQQEVFQRRIVSQQQMTAQLNADSAWNFGPWGPGWWY